MPLEFPIQAILHNGILVHLVYGQRSKLKPRSLLSMLFMRKAVSSSV
ncbi:hypothetical protein C3L33_21690, partial [Rhododendron williamsianum]